MNDFVGKANESLGIHDFFNVVLAGAIFFIGLIVICPYWLDEISLLFQQYSEMKALLYGAGVTILYLTGIVLQDFGGILDKRLFHINDDVMKTFLMTAEKYEEFCNANPQRKLFRWLENGKSIIENENKRMQYCADATKILTGSKLADMKSLGKNYENISDEQAQFVYTSCYYYLEKVDKHKKYEKMRALFDFSRTLMATWIILGITGVFYVLTNYNTWVIDVLHIEIKVCVAKEIAFISLFFVAYYRAYYLMKCKAQMLMGLYDACIHANKRDGVIHNP